MDRFTKNTYSIRILYVIAIIVCLYIFLGAGNSTAYQPEWRHVLPHKERHIKKYGTTRHTYTVQCTNQRDVEPTAENIENLFSSLMTELTAEVEPSHYMGLSIQSPSLDYPITLPYTRLRDFKTADLFKAIENTLNSNQDFAIDGRLKVELTHVAIPEGRGLGGKLKTIISLL